MRRTRSTASGLWGSTEPKPIKRSGNRLTTPATSSLERGGRPVKVSASQARRTPTMSSFSYSAATSSMGRAVARLRKYRSADSRYGPRAPSSHSGTGRWTWKSIVAISPLGSGKGRSQVSGQATGEVYHSGHTIADRALVVKREPSSHRHRFLSRATPTLPLLLQLFHPNVVGHRAGPRNEHGKAPTPPST